MYLEKRKSGISLIGDLPWGSHFCLFYDSTEDLLEILSPYFNAGLENNELCLWVTSETPGAADSKSALQKAASHFVKHADKGQIEIIPFTQWRAPDGESAGTIASMLDRVLTGGFDGLRLAVSAHPEREYEKAFPLHEQDFLSGVHVLAAAAYPRNRFDALRLMEVIKNHHFALVRNAGTWEIIESSEARIAREELRRSDDRLKFLFSSMSEGFAYHRIVLDEEGRPCDYVFLEVNDAFERLTGIAADKLIGKRVTEAIPGVEKDPADWIGRYGEVAMTGKPAQFESYAAALRKWYAVSAFSPNKGYFAVTFSDITVRKKAEEEIRRLNEELKTKIVELSAANALMRDSQRAALNMMEDAVEARKQAEKTSVELLNEINDRKRAEDALRESESRYHSLFENMTEGFAYCKMLFDDRGQPVDFVYLEVNDAFTRLTGLTGVVGKKVTEVIPGIREADPELFRIYGRVALTCKPERFEFFLEKLQMWFSLSVYCPQKEYFVAVFDVITERKRAEEALRQSEEKYRTLFTSVTEGFTLNRALYDEGGKLHDFLVLEANPAAEKFNGLKRENFVGKTWRELWPGAEAYWWDICNKVMREDQEARYENYAGVHDRWYEVLQFKAGKDLMGSIFTDVTERKHAEEEIRRRNAVLAGINAIFTEALSSETDEKLAQACLRVAEELTGSKFGFIGEIGPDGMLHDIAISDPGWELCAMRDKTGHRRPPGNFKPQGIYGRVLHDGKSFFTNDPASHPDSIGMPEGHPPLKAFLGVPFVQDGAVIGMVAVGNRDGGYREEELDSLVALAPAVIEALQRTRSEGALRQSLKRFEILAVTASELLQAVEPQKAVESICRRVMEYLDCHAFFNFLVDENARKLHLNACAGIPEEEARRIEWLDFGRAVCGCVARDGERIIAERIPTTPDERTVLIKSFGIKAYCCHPLLGPGGKVVGTLSFGTCSRETFSDDDLSLMKAVADQVATAMTRKQAEDDILKLSESMAARNLELEALNKELEAFNYSISHDLRAPIRSMAGFSKIVAEDYAEKLDDQGRDYLVRIQNASDKMTHLIDDLLNLSRISRQPIDRMDIDLSKLADSVVYNLREAYAGRSVQIVVREGMKASVDPNLMRVVLTNVLDNAWKFTAKTEKARVEFGSLEKDGETVYFVRDNGAGFGQEYAYKMFWPFHRLHTDKEFAGTGIGLAIVDRIIRRHGGKVWAEGEVGKGATVYFTLG